jgi:hypothetical protein
MSTSVPGGIGGDDGGGEVIVQEDLGAQIGRCGVEDPHLEVEGTAPEEVGFLEVLRDESQLHVRILPRHESSQARCENGRQTVVDADRE